MKQCFVCLKTKADNAFAVRGDGQKGLRSACRSCVNKQNLQRYRTNPTTRESHRRASRRYTLKKYGLTETTYKELEARQGNKCAICGKAEGAWSLAVDHDHITLKVRGLLCRSCNSGIGHLRDDPLLTRRATAYLEGTLETHL